MITQDPDGFEGDDHASYPDISGDGNIVTFQSRAENLVGEDSNLDEDVFSYSLDIEQMQLLSRNSEGDGGAGHSWSPAISGGGRFVTFRSTAANLTDDDDNGIFDDDTNGTFDVFLHDAQTDELIRISINAGGLEADGSSSYPSLSCDGRVVGFQSSATNLVAADANNKADILLSEEAGSEASAEPCPWSGLPPPAPSNLEITDIRPSLIELEWEDNSVTENGFVLQRSINDDEDWAFEEVLPANTASYLDENAVARRTVYEYRLKAVNEDGESVWIYSGPSETLKLPDEQTYGCADDVALNPSDCQGDPVNSATGAYTTSVTDLALPGVGLPFVLRRSYTSVDSTQGVLGRAWTHSYETFLTIAGNGNARLHSGSGQQLVYKLRANGTFKPDPGGRSNLAQVGGDYELTRMDRTVYTFDSSGKLQSIADPNDNELTFTYSTGLIDEVTDTAGRVIAFDHNVSDQLTNIELPDGREVSYDYTDGLLTSVTDARGNDTTYTYDASERLEEIIDQNDNRVIANVYDDDGRVEEQTDARDKVTYFDWDETTQTSTMTDARGNEWKDVYEDNVLISRIDPLGNTVEFDYDSDLNLIEVTDPNGNSTTMTYDDRGYMLTRTAPAPLSHEESFEYDSDNRLTSYTDGRGNTTEFTYDSDGNLTDIDAPLSVSSTLAYDADGLVTSMTDPRGKTTGYDHDSDGNLTEITTPSGNVTTMDHDSAGRMTSLVDARGNEPGASPADYMWTFDYDEANHLTSRSDPLANETEWSYEPAGNLDGLSDAKNRVTDYGYNEANLLEIVEAPDATTTEYDYDDTGNLISRTDANNHDTDYVYDDANRLVSVTSPIGQEWSYGYDPNGNLTQLEDAAGNATPAITTDGLTAYGYDEINRLVAIDYRDATSDVDLSYDANSNLVEMIDGTGTETYDYDALDRLIEVARGTDAFDYEYDDNSQVTKRTYPDGTVVDYAYDDDSRLESVTVGAKTTAYDYNAAGNLLTTTLPSSNGHVEERTYDFAGRLTEIENAAGTSVLSRAEYVLDEIGNPTSMTTLDETQLYEYDPLDRLTEVCFAPSCSDPLADVITYTYDDVGNRLSETRPAGSLPLPGGLPGPAAPANVTTSYSYNDADQLVSTSANPGGTTTYSYDDNGNQTAAGGDTFAYDMANRMTSATVGLDATTYAFDGLGRRIGSDTTGPGGSTSGIDYQWDVNFALPQLVVERDASSGTTQRSYVHGHDLISMSTGGSDSYYHYDGLGSVTNVTNAGGAAQWRYSYEPFGLTRTNLKLDPLAGDNPMQFTGEYLDATGLYHLRARQYDPGLGRFAMVDPMPPQLSRPCDSSYAYANNAPTSTIDPAGLEGCQVNRGGNPPEAYWNIRSHLDFWSEQEQAGLDNSNGFVGFFQWAEGNIFGGALDISGLDTVQASAETSGTACTSGYDKFMSVASIVGVGASWFGARWFAKGREFPFKGYWNNRRFAPFGNRGPGRFQLPHYHRRTGLPGQGKDLHHPWEGGW